MKRKGLVYSLGTVIVLSSVLALTGCGGGSSSTGTLQITIAWPQYSRSIPAASRSIKLQLLAGDQLIAERTVVRSTNDPNTEQVFFTGLNPALITLNATAYPNDDATGVPQAIGSSTVQIDAGRNQQITLAMNSTVDRLEVVPSSISLTVGQATPLTASARDVNGNVVLIAPAATVWESSNPSVLSVTPEGVQATVRGVATGGAIVTVRHTESNKSVQLSVAVNPPDLGGGRITGRVSDTSGNPLAEVRVETSNGAEIRRAFTDTNGQYSLDGVPPGRRVVTFSAGGQRTDFQVVVAQGGVVTLNSIMENLEGSATTVPTITLNAPDVNRNLGQATISGRITFLDSDKAILIVNGAESLFSVNADGTFSTVAILQTGVNSIYVRATNSAGTTLSEELRINYTPSFGDFYFRVTLVWDGFGDIDLHTWDPNNNHSYWSSKNIPTGELDVDNTVSYGPENFTCTNLVPGRYKIAVNSFRNGAGRSAFIRVVINQGPNAGQYDYGPYLFTNSNQNGDYPVRGNTSSWWRPVDIVVSPDGTVSVASPDTSVGLNRGRASSTGRSVK